MTSPINITSTNTYHAADAIDLDKSHNIDLVPMYGSIVHYICHDGIDIRRWFPYEQDIVYILAHQYHVHHSDILSIYSIKTLHKLQQDVLKAFRLLPNVDKYLVDDEPFNCLSKAEFRVPLDEQAFALWKGNKFNLLWDGQMDLIIGDYLYTGGYDKEDDETFFFRYKLEK